MTSQIVYSCDGILPSGMPCRGALSTRTTLDSVAQVIVRQAGWRIGRRGDTCPSCTRREGEAP